MLVATNSTPPSYPPPNTGSQPPVPPLRPPVPPERRRRSPAAQSRAANTPRRDDTTTRQDSGLYLPAWSVLLMMVTVFLVAFGLIGLLIGLGGGAQPGGDPRVVIITAVPSNTPQPGSQTSTPVPNLLSGGTPGSLPNFALEGPTLPPVVLSPTPSPIVPRVALGDVVIVVADVINLRQQPGTIGEPITQLEVGDELTIIAGPQVENNLTWWQVRVTDTGEEGWVAESDGETDLIDVVPTGDA